MSERSLRAPAGGERESGEQEKREEENTHTKRECLLAHTGTTVMLGLGLGLGFNRRTRNNVIARPKFGESN